MPRSVRVEGDELVVRLTGWKAAAALKRELRIPRAAIRSVAPGVPSGRGWRTGGTSVPWTDYRQGHFRIEGRKAFYSVEHSERAVTLELDPALAPDGYELVVLGADHPDALVGELVRPPDRSQLSDETS